MAWTCTYCGRLVGVPVPSPRTTGKKVVWKLCVKPVTWSEMFSLTAWSSVLDEEPRNSSTFENVKNCWPSPRMTGMRAVPTADAVFEGFRLLGLPR